MKTFLGLSITLLSFLIQFSLMAQQLQTLEGEILSPYDNAPIEDAVITVVGGDATARTDSLGEFEIEVSSLQGKIKVVAQGYHELVQPILGREKVVMILVPEDKYNSGEALSTSSSTKTIQSNNFKKGGIYVEDVLQGAFPGLNVINKSGMPGEGSYINLRGIQSLVGANAPLVVVNGMPYLPDMNVSPVIGGFSKSIFNTINLNNVESISLVKGAKASLYGSMGSNGVLLIETSKAREFETIVEFSGQYGVALNRDKLPVLNVGDFKNYIGDIGLTQYEDMGEMLQVFPFLREDPNYYYNFLYNNNTDWQEHIYRPATIADNNLRIRGGDNIAKYDLSVGVLNQDGTLENTFLTRYNTSLNAEITLSQKISLFSTVGFAYINSRQHEQGILNATNPILASLYKAPILNAYEKDEFNNQLPTYDIVRQFNVSNPIAAVNDIQMETNYYDLFLNTGINYKLSENLELTGVFGLFANHTRQRGFIPGKTSLSIVPLEDGVALNTARSGVGKSSNTYYNISARYNKSLGNDNISAGLGYQGLITKQEFDAGKGRNTSSDFYSTLSFVDSEGRNFWGYIDMWNWMSLYGYVDYNFNDLLIASFNVAADGASSTGSDATRFGVFPSGNLTWMMKNMDWLKNASLINKLNLRGGYAITGNSRFSSNYSKQYYTSQIYRELSGITRGNLGNGDLKWETSSTIDFGLDLSIFKNRFQTSVDVYQTITRDVIVPEKVSPVFGTDYRYVNSGEISNEGIEIGLQVALIDTRDFNFTMGGTFAANTNVLKSFGTQSDRIIDLGDGSTIISSVGSSPYSFYGFVAEGVFASEAEAEAAGLSDYKGQAFQAGDMRFKDLNEDGIIDNQDRTILGDASPDFFGGLYASISYKAFSLSANVNYSYGNETYNAMRRQLESMESFYNQSTAVNRRWQTDGQITDIPKAAYGDPMQNSRFSSRWIEDASFIRLANITLNYQISNPILKIIKGGNIYITGENLFTLSNYLGNDPVSSYSYDPMRQGFDYGKLGLPTSVKLGFNIQL